MFCPKCNSFNEDTNAFCIRCGETFFSNEPSPTVMAPGMFGEIPDDRNPSQPTVMHAAVPQVQPILQPPPVQDEFQNSYAAFQQSFPAIPPGAGEQRRGKGGGLIWVAVALLGVVVLAGGALALFFLSDFKGKTSETLPGSLGMYSQSADKTKLTEIRKLDNKDAVAARDKMKDEAPPVVDPKPNIILYADAKDVPLSDLKLIEVESIKDDGSVKQIEYKAATIEGKPDMKRIWVTDELAPGKYAFAVFDGYFEDGKHHFWPFEVKSGTKKDNGDLAKSITIGRKSKTATPTPKTEKTPEPKVEPPPNTMVAHATTSNLVLRSGPSQASSKIGSIASGQKLYVLEYSDNYELFITRDGREINSNYAHIQTESGKRGWVYAAFIK